MCLEGRNAALLIALCSIVGPAVGSASPVHIPPATDGTSLPTSAPTSVQQAPNSQPGGRIQGRLVTSARRPLISGALVLTREESGDPAESIEGTMSPDGSFVFSHVPSGSCVMRALAQTEANGALLIAIFRVTVRDRDIDGVELRLLPGATISGRIIVDPTAAIRNAGAAADSTPRGASLMDVLTGVRVRAPFGDGASFGDVRAGDPLRDGSFTIRGVMAGGHVIVLEGLPAPWFLKAVTDRGQDITDIGLQADSGQRLDDVRITVTDRASVVSGTVRDDHARAVANARVLFVPAPAGLWPRAGRRFARSETDAAGHYSVRGLPAGEYRVATRWDLGERDVYREDVLRAVQAGGVAMTLEPEATRIVDLSVARLRPEPRVAVR